jgi:hypothetical protein
MNYECDVGDDVDNNVGNDVSNVIRDVLWFQTLPSPLFA